jgi:ribosome biogenesis GTPase A
MAIQWYPGHMHKAQKEIKEMLPKVDLLIEVLDSRIPFSSSNPVISELGDFKGLERPIIKIMNKSDLADPELTQLWCQHFESQQNVRAIPVSAHERPAELSKIVDIARKLAPNRVAKNEPVRAMIMGIPNVGKSTIINALSGRKIAKVGNEPAVTQRQQRIDIDGGLVLFDTPGILWPKIENTHSSFRLAISGAIKDTVLEYDEIAFYLVDYLQQQYPDCLQQKFTLDSELTQAAEHIQTIDIVEAIGKKRGCLRAGGRIDLDKVCKILINEYRSASLGCISLETPEMVTKELIEVAEKIRLKAEKDELRKKKPKKRRRK